MKLCPDVNPSGDRNINEMLELLSVDAACACILQTPTKETVLCVVSCVNIELSLNILKRQERRQAHLCLSVFFSLLLLVSVHFSIFPTLDVPYTSISFFLYQYSFTYFFPICLTVSHLYHHTLTWNCVYFFLATPPSPMVCPFLSSSSIKMGIPFPFSCALSLHWTTNWDQSVSRHQQVSEPPVSKNQ